MIIGLTGSIAMGKSTTANMFAELGFPVFNADETVHHLYEKGGKASIEIEKILPDVIVNGAVDRTILAAKISIDKSILPKIEKIVHPMVRKLERQFIENHVKLGTKLIVLDIPLLFETGREQDVNIIIVVSTTPEIQKKRALQRPGITQEKLQLILDRQLPDEEKRAKADYIIDTGVSIDDTFEQVKVLVQKLLLQD